MVLISDIFSPGKEIAAAVDKALQGGDAAGLLELFRSPKGECLPKDWLQPGYTAVELGDTECLRIIHNCGFALRVGMWTRAAKWGHLNCLVFAQSYGYMLNDCVLGAAVHYGHLACARFLVEQGLPREPFLLWDRAEVMTATSPDTMNCIEWLLEKGVAISSRSLIVAAKCGDLDLVRILHKHGVPLWQHVWEERCTRYSESRTRDAESEPAADKYVPPGIFLMPRDPVAVQLIWRTLRYGSLFGAPVTPLAKRVLDEKQQRTRAVLLCFTAAARLSKGPGRQMRRRLWARMAALPMSVVEEILMVSDLEIKESLMHHPPPHAPVAPVPVQCTSSSRPSKAQPIALQ